MEHQHYEICQADAQVELQEHVNKFHLLTTRKFDQNILETYYVELKNGQHATAYISYSDEIEKKYLITIQIK